MLKWRKIFDIKVNEFNDLLINNFIGKFPPGLKGSYIKNSGVTYYPGRKGREKPTHFFDGDGALLKVDFDGTSAKASYKIIETPYYIQEKLENKYIYPGLGMLAQAQADRDKFPPNPAIRANIHVFPIEGRLLALHEGGRPTAVSPNNLKTIGIETFSNALQDKEFFGAHIKADPDFPNTLYDMGSQGGVAGLHNIYKLNTKGEMLLHKKHQVKNFGSIHDFFLTKNYFIFITSPIVFDGKSFMARLKPMMECQSFNSKGKSEIVILKKENLEVVKIVDIDPIIILHGVNGYETENGNIVLDHIQHKEHQSVLPWAKGIDGDKIFDSVDVTKLQRFEIDIKEWKVIKNLTLYDKKTCEMPAIDERKFGKSDFNSYLACADNGKHLYNSIVKINSKSNKTIERNLGDSVVSSITVIPNENKPGWVISTIFDGKSEKSRIHVMEEENLSDVVVFDLPSHVAYGMHGSWINNKI